MLVIDQLKKGDPRLQLLALLMLSGLVLLFGGLWWVQIVQSRKHQASQETQYYRSVRVPALRGKILDRHGQVLAESRATYNVSLYLEDLLPQFRTEYARLRPRQVVTNDPPFWKSWTGSSTVVTQLVRLTASQRSDLIWQARYNVASNAVWEISDRLQQPVSLSFQEFQRHYDTRLAMPLPVMRNLDARQLARFKEQYSATPGVDLDVQSTRVYPYESVAAHLLGYVRRDNDSVEGEDAYFSYRLPDYRGVVGIEGGLDAQLRGRAGAKSVLVNSLGYRMGENFWTTVVPGQNVVLTLDVELQQAVEAALRRRLGAHAPAAAVVMEVHSGDVLALASSPAGNPNYFTRGFPNPEAWSRWTNATLGMQRNRATQEHYQPGSIFKPIIALAALEAGLNPHEKFHVEPNPRNPGRGIIYVGRNREPIRDTASPGDYDLRRALVRSSNSYFVTNALRPGVFERVLELGQRLHLGERFGPEHVPLRQEAAGNFPTSKRVRTNWRDGDTANISIGQGEMDVTPLQMAVMTAALANGGKVLWPRIVARLEPVNPHSLETPEVFPPGQVRNDLGVKPHHLHLVHEALLAETEDPEGTGRPVAVSGLRICGKTGTAERLERGQVRNTVWFISYAPAERPRYAVVVMAEDGQAGGSTCAPIAHDIYVALMKLEATRAGALARTD